MTDYQKLYTGIGRAAWGYFFIYFDFNINTVSILPSFIGYLLFLSAINYLCDEERELNLLRTLVTILTVWHIASWLASWASIDLDGMLQVVDIIIGVVNIYFHFQLLTNLASIAAKYQSEDYELDEKLLRYRTLQTIKQNDMYVQLRNRKIMDEVSFSEQSAELQSRLTTLRTRRIKLISEDKDIHYIDDLRMLKEVLQEAPHAILNFDADLFSAIVEKIRAGNDGTITFVLKGGLKFKERIDL